MGKDIGDIYHLLLEIGWYFGNQGFEEECCEDLTLVEFMALKHSYQDQEISIQKIADSLNVTKSGASRIVDRLENKGYVRRERSSVDGRVCCVPVTMQGIEKVSRILGTKTINMEEILRDIEPDQTELIRDALQMLVKAIHQETNQPSHIDRGGISK
jgi:DNA-binding MarR family transcriptional regulator